jgi:hypothetical protein
MTRDLRREPAEVPLLATAYEGEAVRIDPGTAIQHFERRH